MYVKMNIAGGAIPCPTINALREILHVLPFHSVGETYRALRLHTSSRLSQTYRVFPQHNDPSFAFSFPQSMGLLEHVREY